jgi:hypothetical protein
MYNSKNSNVMFEDGVLMAIALDVRACIGVVVASTSVADPDPLDHTFLGLPDPDPLVRGMDPDPDPSLDPDPSIIMQK